MSVCCRFSLSHVLFRRPRLDNYVALNVGNMRILEEELRDKNGKGIKARIRENTFVIDRNKRNVMALEYGSNNARLSSRPTVTTTTTTIGKEISSSNRVTPSNAALKSRPNAVTPTAINKKKMLMTNTTETTGKCFGG